VAPNNAQIRRYSAKKQDVKKRKVTISLNARNKLELRQLLWQLSAMATARTQCGGKFLFFIDFGAILIHFPQSWFQKKTKKTKKKNCRGRKIAFVL
jgi:hypothetical protein